MREKILRRYFRYRGQLLSTCQGNRLPPGKTIVTIFHDFEGDYSQHGRSKLSLEALPKILDIEQKYDIRGTFNVVARYAQDHPKLISEIRSRGHEIASHSFDHTVLSRKSKGDQKENVQNAKNAFSELGFDVVGHRSPESRWTPFLMNTLIEENFLWIAENGQEQHPYICKTRKGQKLVWFPVQCDDWNYIALDSSPKQMLDYWKSVISNARQKNAFVALGIHPWIQSTDERIAILDDFMAWLSALDDLDIMHFSDVYNLMRLR